MDDVHGRDAGTNDHASLDWIFLLSSLGLLPKAQLLGLLTHKLGALVVLLALVWSGWVLRLQHQRIDGDVVQEQ